MDGRDYSRVVLAEDETERAQEMMTILAQMGEYDVTITKWRAEIDNLLQTTNAGWLILDLNLEDGNSAEIVPMLRAKYGQDLIIFVLSGFYDTYPEHQLLSKGADYYFKKPYSARSLLQQMAIIRDRLEGWSSKQVDNLKLSIGEGVIDVDAGTYRVGGKEIFIHHTQRKLLEALAQARDDEGWKWVDRPRLIMHMYGEDLDVDISSLSDKLRHTRLRLKRTLGEDIIDVHRGGKGRQPSCKLKDEVKVLEE